MTCSGGSVCSASMAARNSRKIPVISSARQVKNVSMTLPSWAWSMGTGCHRKSLKSRKKRLGRPPSPKPGDLSGWVSKPNLDLLHLHPLLPSHSLRTEDERLQNKTPEHCPELFR